MKRMFHIKFYSRIKISCKVQNCYGEFCDTDTVEITEPTIPFHVDIILLNFNKL